MHRRRFLERLPWLSSVLPGGGVGAVRGAGDPVAADVRALGAVGDGRADDSPAFERAVALAAAARVPVVVPPGTYRLTRTVDARDCSGFAMQGAGFASRLFIDTRDRERPLLAVGQRASRRGTHTVHDVVVRDLHLANARDPGHGVGIELSDAARTVLENLRIDYLHDAIRVPAGRWIHKARISNVVAERNAGCALRATGDPEVRTLFGIACLNVKFEHNGEHGIHFGHGSDLVVTAFSHVGGNGGDGIRIEGNPRVRAQACVIDAADLDGNRGYNLVAREAEWLAVGSTWVGGAGGQGVPRAELAESEVVDRAGLLFDRVRSSTVAGVRAINNSRIGIHLRDCWGVTVSDSVAIGNGTVASGSNAGGAGVLVEGEASSFVSLSGVNVSPADGDPRQDTGIWIRGDIRHHVTLQGCLGYNNTERNLRVDAPSMVRIVACDFGDR